MPTLTFWGAARTVTGSMHLLEMDGARILLDCGLFRGSRAESQQRNLRFPFHPRRIDAVVLSHAHVDHCGNLPNLVRQGFAGPIYCTPPTLDLLAIMLTDSARIQEEEAFHHKVIGRDEEAGKPLLYTRQDADNTIGRCVAVPYCSPRQILERVQLRFADAGHILGSAMPTLTFDTPSGVRLTFTGDLGRRGLPFLPDPSAVPPSDLLLCESTYGGTTHQTVQHMARTMTDAVQRTVARGGKVLIPAFSLGRTQVVVYYLLKWMRDGLLSRLPIFVDSPLAAKIATVYQRYHDWLHPETRQSAEATEDFLGGETVHYIRTPEEARHVSIEGDPCIIVASGGMCEAGRILRHLRYHIDDPRSSLVLVSYQSPTSLGRKLLERRPTVRFLGRNWNKWIEVVELNGFSGHADQPDFMAYLGPLAGQVGKVRLIHGEVEQAEALARGLRAGGFPDVSVPLPGESVTFG
jgi:metallo-beta-lactamase family protein